MEQESKSKKTFCVKCSECGDDLTILIQVDKAYFCEDCDEWFCQSCFFGSLDTSGESDNDESDSDSDEICIDCLKHRREEKKQRNLDSVAPDAKSM